MFINLKNPIKIIFETFTCLSDFLIKFFFFSNIKVLVKHIQALTISKTKSCKNGLFKIKVKLM